MRVKFKVLDLGSYCFYGVGYMRLGVRFLGIVHGTVLLLLALGMVFLMTRASSKKRHSLYNKIAKSWSRMMLYFSGIRLDLRDLPVGEAGFYVFNHVSYLDIFVCYYGVQGVFTSKKEIAHWPVIHHLVKIAGSIFIDRSSKRHLLSALKEVESALQSGKNVLFYGEGGISDGMQVRPIKSPFLEICVQKQIPTYYGVIYYRVNDPRYNVIRDVSWVDKEVSFLRHYLRVLRMKRIDATLMFGDKPLFAQDRKILKQELEARMQSLLEGLKTEKNT